MHVVFSLIPTFLKSTFLTAVTNAHLLLVLNHLHFPFSRHLHHSLQLIDFPLRATLRQHRTNIGIPTCTPSSFPFSTSIFSLSRSPRHLSRDQRKAHFQIFRLPCAHVNEHITSNCSQRTFLILVTLSTRRARSLPLP